MSKPETAAQEKKRLAKEEEQRLADLKEEQRLADLKEEQRLADLEEQRLADLEEQRLADLEAEQQEQPKINLICTAYHEDNDADGNKVCYHKNDVIEGLSEDAAYQLVSRKKAVYAAETE